MNQPQQEKCVMCGGKLKQITKHLKDGTQTETIIYVCVNPECPLKIGKTKTWYDN